MKVKSFHAGFAEGVCGAVECLDKQVKNKLGDDIRIHKLTDTLYTGKETAIGGPKGVPGPVLVRVVVYD